MANCALDSRTCERRIASARCSGEHHRGSERACNVDNRPKNRMSFQSLLCVACSRFCVVPNFWLLWCLIGTFNCRDRAYAQQCAFNARITHTQQTMLIAKFCAPDVPVASEKHCLVLHGECANLEIWKRWPCSHTHSQLTPHTINRNIVLQ